jgi:hypothetical protein
MYADVGAAEGGSGDPNGDLKVCNQTVPVFDGGVAV